MGSFVREVPRYDVWLFAKFVELSFYLADVDVLEVGSPSQAVAQEPLLDSSGFSVSLIALMSVVEWMR